MRRGDLTAHHVTARVLRAHCFAFAACGGEACVAAPHCNVQRCPRVVPKLQTDVPALRWQRLAARPSATAPRLYCPLPAAWRGAAVRDTVILPRAIPQRACLSGLNDAAHNVAPRRAVQRCPCRAPIAQTVLRILRRQRLNGRHPPPPHVFVARSRRCRGLFSCATLWARCAPCHIMFRVRLAPILRLATVRLAPIAPRRNVQICPCRAPPPPNAQTVFCVSLPATPCARRPRDRGMMPCATLRSRQAP